MKTLITLLFCCTLTLITVTAQITTTKGMVSSADSLATEAGLRILQKGGTAFDAAIAVAAVLNVTEPMNSGIGGYGTVLIYDAGTKKVRYLNTSGRIPINTNADLMRPPTADYLANRTGAKAVSTPTNLHAWELLHQQYGKMSWQDLFTDAIQIASDGFPINAVLERHIRNNYNIFPAAAKANYGKNGQPLQKNEILVQKDLAHTLSLIASEGADIFYKGAIADKIVKAMEAQQGFLSKKDLEQDKAEWWPAIHINYNGYEVYTAGIPSNAFATLSALSIRKSLSQYKYDRLSPAYAHMTAEIMKLSFQNRLDYSVDPDMKRLDTRSLFGKKSVARQAALFNPDTAAIQVVAKEEADSKNTTHYTIVDQWGNIVSATQTLGNYFGSKIMPEGTGFWLNNSLAYCTYEPKGNPMDAFPGRHKLSGDCPLIILKDRQPWAAVGTPGGHTITQNMAQVIMNMIDWNMPMQDAIDAPKIAYDESGVLWVERNYPKTVTDYLTQKGHRVSGLTFGNVHGITINRDPVTKKIISLTGASDKRGAGLAKGY